MEHLKPARGALRAFAFTLSLWAPLLALAVFLGAGASGCGSDECRLEIVDDSLPNGRVGVAYGLDLTVDSDCWWFDDDYRDANTVWSLVSDELPPGLSLNSLGELRGAPALAGTFTFTVQVEDRRRGDKVVKGFSLTILERDG